MSEQAAATSGPEARTRHQHGHKRGHGEGSIYQRQDGRWVGSIMVGRKADGKPDRRVMYGKTRSDVQKKLDAVRRQVADGLVPKPAKASVSTLLDDWLAECAARGRRPKTLFSYRQVVRLYLKPAMGTLKIAALRPEHVQQLRDHMLARGLSPTTVRNTRTALHGALELAVQRGELVRNVVKLVKPPAIVKPQLRPPTPAELQRLIDTANGSRDPLAPMWIVAAFSGCRPGELLGLGWDDVDWSAGRIYIRRNLVKVPGQPPVLAHPKTASGRRSLRLPAEAMDALRLHHTRQSEEKLRLGPDYGGEWQDARLVFATGIGTPLLPRNVDRQFKRALERAGLPANVRFYDMRHGYATAMLKAGIQPKIAAGRLGHSSTQLFNDTYAHLLAEMDDEAAERAAAVIRQSGNGR